MDPTNPQEQVVIPNESNTQQTQETLEKSNVQARIDELTAMRKAAEQRAEENARQVAQLTATVAQMLERQNAAQVVQQPIEEVPEGVDPNVAKFFSAKLEKMQKQYETQTQQMIWQIQNQVNEQQVAQKYAHLPPEVIQDAAGRLTALKSRYGQSATMDDAVALAHFAWAQKQAQAGRAQQYNQMSQPMMQHGAPPNVQSGAQSTNLMSPASLPNWDSLDTKTQNKLIDEWEKKGGKLLG